MPAPNSNTLNIGARSSSDRGFRGQLGRFRLDPAVSGPAAGPAAVALAKSDSTSTPLAASSPVSPLSSFQPVYHPPPPSQSFSSSSATKRPATTQLAHDLVQEETPLSSGSTIDASLTSDTRATEKYPSTRPTTVAGLFAPDGQPYKAKRVSTACEFCRKRKKKCDFRYPNCSACTRAGVQCTVLTLGQPVTSQAVPRDQIETLQKRVEWLEQLLRSRTGIDVGELTTGSPVPEGEREDGDVEDEQPEPWYRVPDLMARPWASLPQRDKTQSSETLPQLHSPALSVSHSVSNSGSHPSVPNAPLLDGESLPNIGELFRDKLENRPRSIARPGPSMASSPPVRRLPSYEEAEKLAHEYFDGLGLQYPFLHRVEFIRDLGRIYRGDPVPAEVVNCYHITMATAIVTRSTSDETLANSFYRASRDTLGQALQNEDLSALRALLSLALFALSSPLGPSIWQILGTAMRLATSIGLHKPRPSGSGLAEDEMAKRAFWSLYNMDRLVAVMLSRPLGIADEDVTVDLPREYDDQWVESPGTCLMSIPVQVIKLRRIFSRIYRFLYSHQSHHVTDVARVIHDFRRELDDWRTTAPLLPSAILLSTSYYDYLYYTTLLLMYRPSPLNPTPDQQCLVGCGDSSIQVIRSYWDNYQAGKIKWIWLTLCQIYSAGITMLWCIEQNGRASHQGQPLIWDIKEDMIRFGLEAVLTLLNEFAKRRKGTDRLAAAFRIQSTRVIDRMMPLQSPHHLPAFNAASASPPTADPVPHGYSPQPPYNAHSMAPMLGMNPMMTGGDPLYYSYDWGGEEVASYYAL